MYFSLKKSQNIQSGSHRIIADFSLTEVNFKFFFIFEMSESEHGLQPCLLI